MSALARIVLPRGSDVLLRYVRPWSWVGVTPPGAPPALDTVRSAGMVSVVYSLDPGVTWLDRASCAAASALLAAGSPIIIEFPKFADALAARNRLMREVGQ